VVLPLLHGTKSDFLREVIPAPRVRTAKLAESSEATVQRNNLRGCDPQQSASPNFLEGQEAFGHLRQFKRIVHMRGLLQIQMESIMPNL
jgi:hypothetical protein